MSDAVNHHNLNSMRDAEILEAIRAMEATYKQNANSLDHDHRRHLSREELEIVFSISCRVLKTRRIDPQAVLKPFFASRRSVSHAE